MTAYKAPDALYKVAIIGRPNTGKSTLFNRLLGKRLALVDNRPGITRDWRSSRLSLPSGPTFELIDSGGIDSPEEWLRARSQAQMEHILALSDLNLYLLDAQTGVTAEDRRLLKGLRRRGLALALIINKCEHPAKELATRGEAWPLGFGEPLGISAEHGRNIPALWALLEAHIMAAGVAPLAAEPDCSPQEIQLAVVGRPNVGKSTLINRLLGSARLLTGAEAGLTREAISLRWVWRDHVLCLVDTAGQRWAVRRDSRIEQRSVMTSERAMKTAHVVLLLSPADQPLERQDLRIAAQALDAGRCLVIGLSKADRAPDLALAQIKLRLSHILPQALGITVVAFSSHKDETLDPLLSPVLAAHEAWKRRLATPELNEWLEAAVARHPPPLPPGSGRRLRPRLKYMVQQGVAPPTFALMGNRIYGLPPSYMRYLEKNLRQSFSLWGTPIRWRRPQQG